MKRTLILSTIALSLIATAIILIALPKTTALAHTGLQLETPTPDASQIVQTANDAVTQAQNILNLVNIFATILGVVLTFLGVVAGLLAFLGYRSYGEVRKLADEMRKDQQNMQDELRKNLKEVRAEAVNTREALVYLIVGDRLLNLKMKEEALENYRKARSLLPNDSQMNYVLGRLYSGLGEYDAAIAALEAAHPEDTVNQGKVQKELGLAYRRRGESLKQEDDYDIAIQCLKKATLLNPDDSDTFAILGGLYRRKKDYQQALTSYERAWRLNPGSSYALGNLASLSWYFGKVNEAKTFFHYTEIAASGRIKSGQPEGFWDYYDLALAQLVSGNLTGAKKTYAQAINATPSKVQIDAVLNNLYLLQKAPQPLPGLGEIVKMLEDAKAA